MDAGLHLPLLAPLFELAPERDADGDEADEKDLECHAVSQSIRYANKKRRGTSTAGTLRCEKVFSVCRVNS